MPPLSHTVLALTLLPGVGPSTYWKLYENLGGIEALARASRATLCALLKPDLAEAVHALFVCGNTSLPDPVSRCLEWCAANGVQIVSHLDAAYPPRLKQIHRAPPLLYVAGNPACLQANQLALVGSRSASPGGKTKAFEIARDLALWGFVVTSGLALGIDTHAHQGAVAGGGRSVAVLGSGVDQIYPRANLRLAQQLIDAGGCVVSEFPLTSAPLPQNFPQRNRIISGLSLGTVVVEAAEKSGSLITARFALEQNREVFAVPGSTQNPRARGCHALIRQGASLVESAADIVEELSGFAGLAMTRSAAPIERPALDQREITVLAAVDYVATSTEEIAANALLPIGDLLAVLMSLELKGLIEQEAGAYTRTA